MDYWIDVLACMQSLTSLKCAELMPNFECYFVVVLGPGPITSTNAAPVP